MSKTSTAIIRHVGNEYIVSLDGSEVIKTEDIKSAAEFVEMCLAEEEEKK